MSPNLNSRCGSKDAYGDSIADSSFYSYEDTVSDGSDDRILHKSDFESHVNHVDRKLSDFIKVISHLRAKNIHRNWEVVTRSAANSILEQDGEIVTTFLKNKNRRYSWHLVDDIDEGVKRLRQIVWVEIIVNQSSFIYLAEMELKGSETGRSTFCIYKNDLKYMPEGDFETFLEITARQNRWPMPDHKWRSSSAKITADKYFENYKHRPIIHPDFLSTSDSISEAELSLWANNLTSNIRSILNRFIST